MLAGGFIFDEFAKYVWWKLIILGCGFTICIIGILVIFKKS